MAQAQEVDVILAWKQNPVLFVEQVFHATPEPWQREALLAIPQNDRLSIRSGHGVGKSTWLAWVVIWWLLTNHECKVACTAPTAHQLNDVLWGEIAKWVRLMEPALRDLIEVKQDMVIRRDAPKEAFAVARTARREQPEAFQGFHSSAMLFLVDEASGVEDVIFEVGEGAMSTPGAKTIMVGNPTRTNGYFFDSHHKLRQSWWTTRVSCIDDTKVSGRFQSPSFAENMALRYGDESNIYRIRVLGEFPLSEDDVVIPLYLIESAVDRDVDQMPGKIIWGLDVARFGSDRTCLVKRQKNYLLEPPMAWHGKDTMQTAGKVTRMYENTPHGQKPDFIMVDSIGVGAGVVDALRQNQLPVKGVNVAEAPPVGERFVRLRDDLYWRMRDWFDRRDVRIPDGCDDLIGELTMPKYEFMSNGKIKVESKQEMKKRLGRSPDLSDALMMTFGISDMKMDYNLPEMHYEMFV